MKTKTWKPYDLCLVTLSDPNVERGERCYVGEVMSFVTPEQTIMVRRVPNHPGTLDELPIASLAPTRFNARRVIYAEVRNQWHTESSRREPGHGFPSDMLRYDGAVPVNFTLTDEDRGPVARLMEGHEGEPFLVATCYTRFTPARWNSFNWTCTTTKVERIVRPS